MNEKLLLALEDVRRMLGLHQGGIDVIRVDEATGEVVLQFTGACAHCALSSVTMKKGVEVMLCERVPEITKISLVDSHV